MLSCRLAAKKCHQVRQNWFVNRTFSVMIILVIAIPNAVDNRIGSCSRHWHRCSLFLPFQFDPIYISHTNYVDSNRMLYWAWALGISCHQFICVGWLPNQHTYTNTWACTENIWNITQHTIHNTILFLLVGVLHSGDTLYGNGKYKRYHNFFRT